MKKIILLCIFVNIAFNLFAQSNFSILGQTNFIKNGNAILCKTAFYEFYHPDLKDDTVKIIDNKFEFYDKISHAEQFRIKVLDSAKNYITEPFFIDSGFQKVRIDSTEIIQKKFDFGYGIKVEGSKTNDEYYFSFLPLFDSINKKIKIFLNRIDNSDTIMDDIQKKEFNKNIEIERNKIRWIRDSILLNYALQNKRSQILAWQLYEAVRKYGYKEIYQKINDIIRPFNDTSTIKRLTKLIEEQKLKLSGNIFPLFNYIKKKIPFAMSKSNFVLVDFWYSGCAPCLSQFELIRPYYKEFNKKGFEIIAISTDTKPNIEKYKSLLVRKKYPWKQILDINGAESSIINIQKFPTNFLLDSQGKIIALDITPDELNLFLDKNLSANTFPTK